MEVVIYGVCGFVLVWLGLRHLSPPGPMARALAAFLCAVSAAHAGRQAYEAAKRANEAHRRSYRHDR